MTIIPIQNVPQWFLLLPVRTRYASHHIIFSKSSIALLLRKSVGGLQRRARLSTTNTEAFRCVSDSFTTHTDTSDPLSPSEEACPLKRREKHCSAELQPAKKCRNVRNIFKSDGKLPRQGTEMSISAGSSISRTARAIKSAKCNILLDRVKLSIHSQTPLSRSLKPVNDFKPFHWRFPWQDPPSIFSKPPAAVRPSVGPPPAPHPRDRQHKQPSAKRREAERGTPATNWQSQFYVSTLKDKPQTSMSAAFPGTSVCLWKILMITVRWGLWTIWNNWRRHCCLVFRYNFSWF